MRIWLVVGPLEAAKRYVRDHGWRPSRVDVVETADELRHIFDPAVHAGVALVDIARLGAGEVKRIGEELRIIRTVWREVWIDPEVVAQIDSDPSRVPVLC